MGVKLRLVAALALVASLFATTLSASGQDVPPYEPHAYEFGTDEFHNTWARTDLPVDEGQTQRTWLWGPGANTPVMQEPYYEAGEDQKRDVQYTDKSRMEMPWNHVSDRDGVSPWAVTQGLLAWEMMSGQVQLGDELFVEAFPSEVHVAGDPNSQGPTYATMGMYLDAEPRTGENAITEFIHTGGHVDSLSHLTDYGVNDVDGDWQAVDGIDQPIADVFLDFINSTGTIWDGTGFVQDQPVVQNPFYAVGYPLTPAFWTWVPVDGVNQNVLVQCFERRCLTYTPDNDDEWQVESGNVGQHYFEWRYEQVGDVEIPSEDPVDPPSDDVPPTDDSPPADDDSTTDDDPPIADPPEPGTPSFEITQDDTVSVLGASHTITVTVLDENQEPLQGADVSATVSSGPHATTSLDAQGDSTVQTDGDGEASLSYTGTDEEGTDTITVVVEDGGSSISPADSGGDTVTAEWTYGDASAVVLSIGGETINPSIDWDASDRGDRYMPVTAEVENVHGLPIPDVDLEFAQLEADEGEFVMPEDGWCPEGDTTCAAGETNTVLQISTGSDAEAVAAFRRDGGESLGLGGEFRIQVSEANTSSGVSTTVDVDWEGELAAASIQFDLVSPESPNGDETDVVSFPYDDEDYRYLHLEAAVFDQLGDPLQDATVEFGVFEDGSVNHAPGQACDDTNTEASDGYGPDDTINAAEACHPFEVETNDSGVAESVFRRTGSEGDGPDPLAGGLQLTADVISIVAPGAEQDVMGDLYVIWDGPGSATSSFGPQRLLTGWGFDPDFPDEPDQELVYRQIIAQFYDSDGNPIEEDGIKVTFERVDEHSEEDVVGQGFRDTEEEENHGSQVTVETDEDGQAITTYAVDLDIVTDFTVENQIPMEVEFEVFSPHFYGNLQVVTAFDDNEIYDPEDVDDITVSNLELEATHADPQGSYSRWVSFEVSADVSGPGAEVEIWRMGDGTGPGGPDQHDPYYLYDGTRLDTYLVTVNLNSDGEIDGELRWYISRAFDGDVTFDARHIPSGESDQSTAEVPNLGGGGLLR